MKIKRKLLQQLADHLKFGRLGHMRFDFNTIHTGFPSYGEKPKRKQANTVCGTAGCAMGELPIVFPDEWKFCKFSVRPRNVELWDLTPAVAKYFGITVPEAVGLFYPHNFCPWNVTYLDTYATREEVARGIENFLDWSKTQRLNFFERQW